MKKILIISSFILVLFLTSIIGYKVVSANTKINEVEDIITYQDKLEDYLTYYNYTFDNPNIIIDPYGISPLTAMILFERGTEEEVYIKIPGKDKNSTYENTFEKSKVHYIPIFGLYPDYNNEIIITCGNNTKKINIKTDKLPEDLIPIQEENNTNSLYFITTDNYTYAIDNNNEVRWYLTKKYNKKISRLKNGHLLLSNDTMIDNQNSSGLVEIDLLGKVYNEYDLGVSYNGSYAETDKTLLILSKNLLEVDKQTGEIIREINLDSDYKTLSYDNKTNKIILKKEGKTLLIDYKSGDTIEQKNYEIEQESKILLQLYNFMSYNIATSTKFTNNKETLESKKHVFLLNYKKIDNNYKKHNITIKKEEDRLVINGTFKKEEKAYLILDKFLGKKVYDLENGYNYINSTGLSGDYSIYIKIDNKIYKTNNYVTF